MCKLQMARLLHQILLKGITLSAQNIYYWVTQKLALYVIKEIRFCFQNEISFFDLNVQFLQHFPPGGK